MPEGELETLSRMTNRPTIDYDFSSSLTSFFLLFKIEWRRIFRKRDPITTKNAVGVNCRLIACSKLRDNRARGIEKARTQKREETEGRRGGLRLSLSRLPHFFSPFPYSRALRSLSESLEQASRHTTYRIKEEPRIKHLKWLTCDFASCRKRTQNSASFICRWIALVSRGLQCLRRQEIVSFVFRFYEII